LERCEPYPAAETLERLLEWTGPARAELGIEVSLPSINGAQRQRSMLESGMSLPDVFSSVVGHTRDTYAGALGSTAEVTR
jgi:glutamate---cysteine ligase / carboxylate-amine ligase